MYSDNCHCGSCSSCSCEFQSFSHCDPDLSGEAISLFPALSDCFVFWSTSSLRNPRNDRTLKALRVPVIQSLRSQFIGWSNLSLSSVTRLLRLLINFVAQKSSQWQKNQVIASECNERGNLSLSNVIRLLRLLINFIAQKSSQWQKNQVIAGIIVRKCC